MLQLFGFVSGAGETDVSLDCVMPGSFMRKARDVALVSLGARTPRQKQRLRFSVTIDKSAWKYEVELRAPFHVDSTLGSFGEALNRCKPTASTHSARAVITAEPSSIRYRELSSGLGRFTLTLAPFARISLSDDRLATLMGLDHLLAKEHFDFTGDLEADRLPEEARDELGHCYFENNSNDWVRREGVKVRSRYPMSPIVPANKAASSRDVRLTFSRLPGAVGTHYVERTLADDAADDDEGDSRDAAYLADMLDAMLEEACLALGVQRDFVCAVVKRVTPRSEKEKGKAAKAKAAGNPEQPHDEEAEDESSEAEDEDEEEAEPLHQIDIGLDTHYYGGGLTVTIAPTDVETRDFVRWPDNDEDAESQSLTPVMLVQPKSRFTGSTKSLRAWKNTIFTLGNFEVGQSLLNKLRFNPLERPVGLAVLLLEGKSNSFVAGHGSACVVATLEPSSNEEPCYRVRPVRACLPGRPARLTLQLVKRNGQLYRFKDECKITARFQVAEPMLCEDDDPLPDMDF